MFSQLANYLLGTTTSDEQEQTASGVDETTNTRLNDTRVLDDDWVFVDRDSEGNSEVSSVESLDDDDLEHRALDDHHPLSAILTRTSSTSSMHCGPMDESWYITPPPCFTSAGPIYVETSPLENLLIEHPSMSVYQHSAQPVFLARRLNAASLQPVADLIREDVDVDVVVEEPAVLRTLSAEVRVERRAQVPRRNRLDVFQQQERQRIKMKHAQKVQLQKACQTLKRGYLERTNKAREVNSRNQRQRRGERSQGATRSHANNNRKC